MGSVKDLVVLEAPSGDRLGRGRFRFSDRYSVFDWGEMPDHIEGKGAALCLMGACFFEKLEATGMATHYLGVVGRDGVARRLEDLDGPADTMEIRLVRVIEPETVGDGYDYSAYRAERGNFLIPLEVIYRNSLPEGSSVFKRLEEGSLRIEDLGLESLPVPGERLERPVLDVSTKLEATDRYLGWEEAGKISGLSSEELRELKEAALRINELITRTVEPLGLENQDGKVEFAFDEERRLMLVDVLGTPDECRFEYRGMPVSKEVARIFYRNTEWAREVEEAKKTDRLGWKGLVRQKPPPLPARMKELLSLLYKSCCEGMTGKRFFGAPPLEEILAELGGLIEG
ncbi:MAG: phosphoribosylaminoimidazolesuccinocarboxamide synthase [Actinobacteria bacterium]|nr:phosphoribosylaminoimidazolesuccinocarboxamide synthase [Actinomycetota bacterium]